MSNIEAVQKYLNKMSGMGFKSTTFLIHKDDVDKVRSLVDKLKEQRLSEEFLKPENTIEEMNRLNLDNKTFSLLHHFGSKASVKAHMSYLKKISAYQSNSQNYIVAQRIHQLDSLILDDIGLHQAIKQTTEKYPFF
ncbi:hypothetical protein AU255_11670 [Methyloprofundus sedimenti]|uniref:Uncharacterized protein n=1 Tax=Methyloprofundus sedimenti TaxID=1420851 RepID=A0A1V8MA19_9GAMM|nr:hypothetical protein [Methyloprofundus sedimenti]OQK18441.1 hypothetical protein AU255_11670 [Methyloprofundus sedimenti]